MVEIKQTFKKPTIQKTSRKNCIVLTKEEIQNHKLSGVRDR